METTIDPRAAEAHAWLDGYSLGAAGKEYQPNPYLDGELADEHRRGYEKGRELFLSPVKR